MEKQKTIEKQMQAMHREIRRMRSLLVSILVEDREGAYKPSFMKRVQSAASRKPTKTFKDAQSFLSELDKV